MPKAVRNTAKSLHGKAKEEKMEEMPEDNQVNLLDSIPSGLVVPCPTESECKALIDALAEKHGSDSKIPKPHNSFLLFSTTMRKAWKQLAADSRRPEATPVSVVADPPRCSQAFAKLASAYRKHMSKTDSDAWVKAQHQLKTFHTAKFSTNLKSQRGKPPGPRSNKTKDQNHLDELDSAERSQSPSRKHPPKKDSARRNRRSAAPSPPSSIPGSQFALEATHADPVRHESVFDTVAVAVPCKTSTPVRSERYEPYGPRPVSHSEIHLQNPSKIVLVVPLWSQEVNGVLYFPEELVQKQSPPPASPVGGHNLPQDTPQSTIADETTQGSGASSDVADDSDDPWKGLIDPALL